jgi:hypothetical protein
MSAAAIALILCGTALAFPPDATDRVRSFRPGDKIDPLPSATWTVVEEIQQPDGHTRPATPAKQVAMGGGLRMGGEVLLVEAAGGRCLIGTEDSPNHFKASREFRSFDEYVAANSYAPLPTPPKGLTIRQLTTMPSMPVRITSDGGGKWLYVLSTDGNVFRVDLPGGQTTNVIPTASYGGHGGTLGITLDRDRRLYIVENAFNLDVVPQRNHVSIFLSKDVPADGGTPT